MEPIPPGRIRWRSWSIVTLLMLMLLRLVVLLPYRHQLTIGEGLGQLLLRISSRWRKTAAENLQRAFPQLSTQQRQQLLQQNLRNTGVGLIETGLAWWGRRANLLPLTHLEGQEHLDAALQQGHGVILLSAHTTTLEIGGRLLSHHYPLDAMYRHQSDIIFHQMMLRGRSRFISQLIHRNDVRTLIRNLKRNHIVWYAMDQHFRGNHSAYVPFFGTPAATNTSAPRIAKVTGAAVIPYTVVREPHTHGYRLTIHPPFDPFPSDDPIADTSRIMAHFEQQIRQQPDQYLWIHRRFKSSPPATEGEKG